MCHSAPRKLLLVVLVILGAVGTVRAQTSGAAGNPDNPVYVDPSGILRWTGTDDEVSLFGVNYTTPFAHVYRAMGYLGVDRRKAIEADVDHLARLGLDAFRVHVWEREVADSVGNLVENDHLDLYDFLVARLAERGIRTILTPIAWWDTGYPERVPPTGAFTDGYSKGDMTTDPVAIAAQVRYLKQFVAHVNPYTGRAYRDDPAVIAMELFNEPNHPGPAGNATTFINTLAAAARSAGWAKPVFYNISEGYNDDHARAVCDADIQGVAMQWYPTGLVRNGAIGGNPLPNVDRYPTPFDAFEACADKARMVYEFDAADVAGSFMYPIMARSFRGAGVQFAAQFAYDPLAIAYANTEYQTHFVNLVHAPSKAISLMIAGEVFRRVPRRSAFPAYPEGSRFSTGSGAGAANFRVSHSEDLSEMAADTLFLHSNTTGTRPPDASKLRHVAGVGSSPVVRYAGTGAYFLDRVDESAWRLEIYPDAVWVEDPFTRPSLDRRAVDILWEDRPMQVELPGLGEVFLVEPLDEGNEHRPVVQDGTFTVRPGVYVLRSAGSKAPIGLRTAFHAPPPSNGPTRVVHTPPLETLRGSTVELSFTVSSATPPDSVLLFGPRGRGFGPPRPVRLESDGGPVYRGTATAISPGLLSYRVTVYRRGEVLTFPGSSKGAPFDWDFTGRDTYSVPVVEDGTPVELFDGGRDRDRLLVPHMWQYVRFRSGLTGGQIAGDLALRAEVTDFSPYPHHFALRTTLPPGLSNRLGAFGDDATMHITARSTGADPDRVEIALVLDDGSAWGTVVDLAPEWRSIEIPVSSLQRVDLYLLPRPYPQFLPYRFRSSSTEERPDLGRLDGVQFALDAELFPSEEPPATHGFEIERVVLSPGHADDGREPEPQRR